MRLRNLAGIILVSTATAVVAGVFAGRELWGQSPAITTEAPPLAPNDGTDFVLSADPILIENDHINTFGLFIPNGTCGVPLPGSTGEVGSCLTYPSVKCVQVKVCSSLNCGGTALGTIFLYKGGCTP